MRHIVLCDGPRFRLERRGGGHSYALTHIAARRGVFVQGDDALRLEADMEAIETACGPELDADGMAWRLWNLHGYSEAAEAV